MRRIVQLFVLCALVLAILPAPARAQIDARMLRYPDVSATHVAFVHAGDIWVMTKDGGSAQRLSSPRGEELLPRFSPDGQTIAFSGNYDGNVDVYTVPTLGGTPRRLTHHPGDDLVLDWTPGGDGPPGLLFRSGRESPTPRFHQVYHVGAEGGLPERLPPAIAEFAALAEDGKTLAFQFLERDFRTWKRYRGGTTPDIWLFDLETRASRNLTDHPANDSQPMWRGSTVYFLSDRGAHLRANLWAVDAAGGAPRQLTHFADFDVRFPSIGPHEIVFEAGGRLYLLELDTGVVREVEVRLVSDRSTLKPRVEPVSELIASGDVSPQGRRAVFEARGEIFTVPAEHGPIRNLSRSAATAERYPAWSPDGRSVAYWSDASGEYQLTLAAADGSRPPETLTSLGPGFRYPPRFSPDSRRLVFLDQTHAIQVLELETRELTTVGKASGMTHGGLERFRISWSGDGRWLAWDAPAANEQPALVLHDTADGATHRVTTGYYADARPVFDPEGKYLYFLTQRSLQPSFSDLDNSWIYANTTRIAAVPLRGDVPSPLVPRNDEESSSEEPGSEEPGEDDGEPAPAPVEIDLEGFAARVEVLPPSAGNYLDLVAVPGKVVYHRAPRTGDDREERPLLFWDLEERQESTILPDVDAFALAVGGEKLLVLQDAQWGLVDVAAEQKVEKPLRTGELELRVDPAAEWRQIFREAWRLQRDFFYDPGLHGVDWDALGERYGALVDDAVTRWDVNHLIGELIGELNASHAYRGGGDLEEAPERGVGLLGADFALENGAYRIARVVRGAPWDSEVRSPLDRAGVAEGEYLLAVNGVPLDVSRDPWAAFEGLAGQAVFLTVGPTPELAAAREVLVETLDSELRLRYLEWVEANRRWVEEASAGRVGYVHVPDTGGEGQTELVRQLFGQSHKDGLVIDERFNSGGQYPDRFIELLTRRRTGYIGFRDTRPVALAPRSRTGPQVMLINAWAGSGGDLLPYLFREAGLGPLIGTRTWGGLIGISGAPSFIDGGSMTTPNLPLYGLDGEWLIEGHGVEPDIEVGEDPTALSQGRDPQLERAVEEVLRRLEAAPPVFPEPPPYDDRTSAGATAGKP